jgi:hypothetical protein
VLAEIRNVMSTTAGLTVTVTQPTINGIPMAQVQVSGTVPYLRLRRCWAPARKPSRALQRRIAIMTGMSDGSYAWES